jgi:hypothetical protein
MSGRKRVKRRLKLRQQGVVSRLLSCEVDKLAYLIAMLDRIESGPGVPDELVLIRQQGLVVNVSLATQNDDVAIQEFTKCKDILIHLPGNFRQRTFDLSCGQVICECDHRSADSVSRRGIHHWGMRYYAAEISCRSLIQRLQIRSDSGCRRVKLRRILVRAFAGKFDKGAGVGFEAVEDRDASLQLLRG